MSGSSLKSRTSWQRRSSGTKPEDRGWGWSSWTRCRPHCRSSTSALVHFRGFRRGRDPRDPAGLARPLSVRARLPRPGRRSARPGRSPRQAPARVLAQPCLTKGVARAERAVRPTCHLTARASAFSLRVPTTKRRELKARHSSGSSTRRSTSRRGASLRRTGRASSTRDWTVHRSGPRSPASPGLEARHHPVALLLVEHPVERRIEDLLLLEVVIALDLA